MSKEVFTADEVKALFEVVADNAVSISRRILLARLAVDGLAYRGLETSSIREHLEGLHELTVQQDINLTDVYELFVQQVDDEITRH